jgi:hypothetical protein
MKRISPIFFLKIFVPDRVDGPGTVDLPDLNNQLRTIRHSYDFLFKKPINESGTIIPNIRGITSQCSFPLTEYRIRIADPQNFNE